MDSASNKTLATRIADQLRDDIVSQKLQPGSRITVKEIADRYAVSSMPVREAFNALCGEQLLEMNPYRGATVKAVTSKLFIHLNEVQSALEPLLMELVMQKGFPRDLLPRLEEINHEIAILEDNPFDMSERRNSLNMEFHSTLYSPCKDHMAYSIFWRNINQMCTIRKYHVTEYRRAQETVNEHALIIDAVRNNDILTATTLMRLHARNSIRYILQSNEFDD